MKNRIIVFICALSAVFAVCSTCLFAITASADGNPLRVFVTISDGSLVLTREEITVNDADGDGSLTVNDALILAHDKEYSQGSAGYGYTGSDYGISMTKLWGIENGGSYGYYLNNKSVVSLADTLKDGDSIYAYVYSDTVTFSDVYSYFVSDSVTCKSGEGVTLTLLSVGFDENWSAQISPVAGASILIDGSDSGITTDKDGKATVAFDKSGTLIISAVSDKLTLVPPVCTVKVEKQSIGVTTYIIMAAAVISAAGVTVFAVLKAKKK